MKFALKKGRVNVTIEYQDYAAREIENASAMLGISPLEVCISAHRLMVNIAATEPALFASMVREFQNGFKCTESN